MPYIPLEPQSRNTLETHSNNLLSQFDTQLQVISERYLAFFQERRHIGTTYIASLRRLHRTAKDTDVSLGLCAESTMKKAAWEIVRDNLEREADNQQVFVENLDEYVIKPLSMLKASKDETRKRIEEDLRRSAAKYADHAENTVSMLQQASSKKHFPQQYSHSTEPPQRPQDIPNKWVEVGSKISSLLFRGRWEDPGLREAEPVKSEVSDDDCRRAVGRLNEFRSMRAENLGDGYDCLSELVFTGVVDDALVTFMDNMVTASEKHVNLAINTSAEVKKTLVIKNTSDLRLRSSFRRDLELAIPPPTLYCNHRPNAYSDLIFGVPLVDDTTTGNNEADVPIVMRMCIEEVEKRGLSTKRIYSGSLSAEVLQLRRRLESEKTFLFSSSADNIRDVAMLLKLYLWELPEPLFVLSLREYRNYRQNRVKDTGKNLNLLSARIRKLRPKHRASLGAIFQHLSRVASHSDENGMTVEALVAQFTYAILRGNVVMQGGVDVKKLVVEDLIKNADAFFDKRLSPSLSGLSLAPEITETKSLFGYGSMFLSTELPHRADLEFHATGSTSQHRTCHVLVDGVSSFTQSSSSLPSDAAMESRLTTALTNLHLGLPSSQTLAEEVEKTSTHEKVIPEVSGTLGVEIYPNSSTPAECASVPPKEATVPHTVVSEEQWQQPEAVTSPQSLSESITSSTSGFPAFSTTSSQTRMASSSV